MICDEINDVESVSFGAVSQGVFLLCVDRSNVSLDEHDPEHHFLCAPWNGARLRSAPRNTESTGGLLLGRLTEYGTPGQKTVSPA